MKELPWKGDQFKKRLRSVAARRLEAACIVVQNEAKQLLVQHDNIDGSSPSAPGQPPAKVTGRLSGSVSREVDDQKLVGRVGSNVLYAKFTEMGTRFMAARPWLRPAFANTKAMVAKIIKGGR